MRVLLKKIKEKITNTTDRLETIGRHLFRKGDFDPRTTVTVKKEYSEGREALEEEIPRIIPEKILLTTSVRPKKNK